MSRPNVDMPTPMESCSDPRTLESMTSISLSRLGDDLLLVPLEDSPKPGGSSCGLLPWIAKRLGLVRQVPRHTVQVPLLSGAPSAPKASRLRRLLRHMYL